MRLCIEEGKGQCEERIAVRKPLAKTNPPPLFILPCFPSPPSPSVVTRRSPSLIHLSRRSLRPMSNPSTCWAVGDPASPLPSPLEVDSEEGLRVSAIMVVVKLSFSLHRLGSAWKGGVRLGKGRTIEMIVESFQFTKIDLDAPLLSIDEFSKPRRCSRSVVLFIWCRGEYFDDVV